MKSLYLTLLLCCVFVSAGCAENSTAEQNKGRDVAIEVLSDFNEPWALDFLPDGRLLVTEKPGTLKLFSRAEQSSIDVTGVPEVSYGGQGGLGDITVDPDFATNQRVYLSYVEPGDGVTGAAVASARLDINSNSARLTDLRVLWRQSPKVTGQGHYGHRVVIGPQGYLWISSGERQKFDPAQDMSGNLGKIVRLNRDGSIPQDNPFSGAAQGVWSLGHRNPLGLAFDANEQLWVVEMGPKGGDELNRVERGADYGYPTVSNGDHYNGAVIPDHDTQPRFKAPAITWTPVISPSSLMFYSGSEFPQWQGQAMISGLSAKGIVRVEFDGVSAREVGRIPLDARIRSVAQGPDGALWVLEDERRGSQGRLLRLTAAL